MSAELREFGLFIDGLRVERNISREDLIDGLMSLSQYKRYLRGDTSIPNKKLLQLSDRLKISVSDLHSLYNRKYNEEYNIVLNLYFKIRANNCEEAYEEAQQYKHKIFLSDYNQQFFDFIMLYLQHYLKIVSDVHILTLYSNLINYPECTDKKSFNMVEMATLIQIADLSSRMNNFEAADFLYQVLTSKEFEFASSLKVLFIPSIYSNLSKIIGNQQNYERLIDISEKGIEFCIENETTTSLAHLYMYNSFGYHLIDKIQKSYESLKKCMMLLYIENKKNNFESFKNIFEKRFDIKLKEIIDLNI